MTPFGLHIKMEKHLGLSLVFPLGTLYFRAVTSGELNFISELDSCFRRLKRPSADSQINVLIPSDNDK